MYIYEVNDRPSTTRTKRICASHSWASIARPHIPGTVSLVVGTIEYILKDFMRYHWSVHQRIQHKLCTMMHSVHYGKCPQYLADTVSASADNPTRPGLRSADSTVYRLPRWRTSVGKRASLRTTRVKRSAFNTP